MSDAVIRTEGLTKRYGDFTAVNDLTLQVNGGVLFGFIGPNGAGKSTTIRMLCGLLKPSAGKAFVGGVDVARHPREAKRMIGYLPELFGTYDRMRVWEYLDFFGAAYRIGRKKRRQQIERILELTGTDYMRDFFVGTLSKGMRQRVGIAKTLVHDPAVLFLDEPMGGLDPVARIETRELIRNLKALGKSVFISSHILPELASVCDEIGIIEKGTLLTLGPIRKILAEIRQTRTVQLQVMERPEDAAKLLQHVKEASEIKVVQNVIQFEFSGDNRLAANLIKRLQKNGLDVCWMNHVEADLEEAFIHVTGRKADSSGTATAS